MNERNLAFLPQTPPESHSFRQGGLVLESPQREKSKQKLRYWSTTFADFAAEIKPFRNAFMIKKYDFKIALTSFYHVNVQ